MEKRYDFEKNCINNIQADYVINSIINEYSQSDDWIIGKTIKEPLPNGEIKVIVELTKLTKNYNAPKKR